MNKRFAKSCHLLCVFVFIILFTASLLSQPKRGIYDITTTISKGFLSSSNISTNNGALNIGMAYIPSDRISVRSDLGFRSQTDTSGALGFGSATDIVGKGTSLLSVSGFFGAEYWFSPHFSWFGHIGLISASYKIAEKPASDVFTSAATGLTWYF